MEIISNDGRQKLNISVINTHLFVFHECGFEFTTQRKRRVTVQWWNPATWWGFEWVNSNRVLQPAITDLKFFMGNGTERNPVDFALSNTRTVGHFKSSAVSVNVANPPANNVSWITSVTLTFEYDGRSRSI